MYYQLSAQAEVYINHCVLLRALVIYQKYKIQGHMIQVLENVFQHCLCHLQFTEMIYFFFIIYFF